MGIRSKQLNMNELYTELDGRYGSSGRVIDVTILAGDWKLVDSDRGYYCKEITIDDENLIISETSNLIVQSKFDLEKSYEENIANESHFSNIIKAESGDGKIIFYSNANISFKFTVSVLVFN